jgi:hypothetical protein
VLLLIDLLHLLPLSGVIRSYLELRALRCHQAAPFVNVNPSTAIPTATAAIGSKISAVAFALLAESVHVSAYSRKLIVVPRTVRVSTLAISHFLQWRRGHGGRLCILRTWCLISGLPSSDPPSMVHGDVKGTRFRAANAFPDLEATFATCIEWKLENPRTR